MHCLRLDVVEELLGSEELYLHSREILSKVVHSFSIIPLSISPKVCDLRFRERHFTFCHDSEGRQFFFFFFGTIFPTIFLFLLGRQQLCS